MGLKATKKNNVVIPAMEVGTYTAVCIGIVDLGEQYSARFTKYQDRVSLTFEVIGETIERGNGQEPRWVSKEYTKSLNDRANLFKDLSKWRGISSEDELAEYDLSQLMNAPCLISVGVKERDNGGAINVVEGVMALPKGMPAPKAQSETFLFDMDDQGTWPVLEKMPQFMREKIEKSTTWARIQAGTEEMDMDEPSPKQAPGHIDMETGEITPF